MARNDVYAAPDRHGMRLVLDVQSDLLYALKTHRRNRARFAVDCQFLGKDKTVVRLQSPREVEAFLAP